MASPDSVEYLEPAPTALRRYVDGGGANVDRLLQESDLAPLYGSRFDAIVDTASPTFDIQIFYFPREVAENGGGTRFVPGSHLRRARAAAVAWSKMSGDEKGVILGQLRKTLEPRLVMYFSSASKELRALLTPAVQQQLRTDYEDATALCVKMGMRNCKKLREATRIRWEEKSLSAADLATLAKLGAVLPALVCLRLVEHSGSAGLDGVQRLAEGLVTGALPAMSLLTIIDTHVGDAGASAIAAALDRGAMPRLEVLALWNAAIGDAGLVALAPALRRRPALERLDLAGNPFGDEGLAALVAPRPADAPPPQAEALAQLKVLHLDRSQITDDGCAHLASRLRSGALPALGRLFLGGIPASEAARAAVQHEARPGLHVVR